MIDNGNNPRKKPVRRAIKRIKKAKSGTRLQNLGRPVSATVTNEEAQIREDENSKTETGVKNFLNLKTAVSTKWSNSTSVLEETRRSRRHETIK